MSVLVAMEFDSKYGFEGALSIAANYPDRVDEDFDYCIQRERGVEALYCLEHNIPCVIYSRGGIITANVDLDALPEDTRVLYRARASNHFVNPVHERLGLKPLVTEEDEAHCEFWPQHVQMADRFLGRNVSLMEPADLASQIEANAVKLPLFIKNSRKINEAPLHKVFWTQDELRDGFTKDPTTHLMMEPTYGGKEADLFYHHKHPDWYCPYRDCMQKGRSSFVALKDPLIVSDPMDIQMDNESDNGKVECRCFIGPKGVLGGSRYVDYKDLDVPQDVFAFADDFASTHEGVFGDYYVLDVARLADQSLSIVELNPYSNSGRYVGIRVEPLFDSLAQTYDQSRFKMIEADYEIDVPDEDRGVEVGFSHFLD